MSAPPNVGNETTVKIGNTVVEPQPDQRAFPLTRDKFDLLQAGEVNSDREARNVALGIFVGAVVGTIGFAATAPWDKYRSFFVLAILGAIVLCSGACAGIFGRRAGKALRLPGCKRVLDEIETHFNPPK